MSWEFDILYFLQSIRNPVLDVIMLDITRMGDAGAFWIAIAIALLFHKRTRVCGISMLLALTVSVITCNLVLKNLVMRDRPCWIDSSIALLINNPQDYSFPSGHTYASMVAAFVMAHYNKYAGRLAIFTAALIAFSRLYLFVHFPTDVLISVILASITAKIVVWVADATFEDMLNDAGEMDLQLIK